MRFVGARGEEAISLLLFLLVHPHDVFDFCFCIAGGKRRVIILEAREAAAAASSLLLESLSDLMLRCDASAAVVLPRG